MSVLYLLSGIETITRSLEAYKEMLFYTYLVELKLEVEVMKEDIIF